MADILKNKYYIYMTSQNKDNGGNVNKKEVFVIKSIQVICEKMIY